ncbi:peptide deformylase [Streptomyces sp. NPDC006259]|uniref:peptide deformylase n=1 Tax=Streptomyces sp. NPDC006259 TaxID=3364740 RepID=UPI00369D2CF9
MGWTVKHDRDAFKEVWLQFQSATSRFPLYPGQEAEICYSYSVSADKWGPWFQRAVRLPTRRLSVELAFPTVTEPTVWGTQTSMSTDFAPLRTPPRQSVRGDRTVFAWSTMDPPLHARFRLEWRLKNPDTKENSPVSTLSASQAMANAGIVQEGSPVLASPVRPFDLPAEADEAQRVIHELFEAVDRVRQLHTFGKGIGIAAPQIGIDRSAAVVAHSDLNGTTWLSRFNQGMAGLVAHEIDHLDGILYRKRMRSGVLPIPVEEYQSTGSQWKYE